MNMNSGKGSGGTVFLGPPVIFHQSSKLTLIFIRAYIGPMFTGYWKN
jgi:hypothetical protein